MAVEVRPRRMSACWRISPHVRYSLFLTCTRSVGGQPMQVYTWRLSLAAFRVRIVMKLNGIPAEEHQIDLRQGQQHDPACRAVNPQGAVPVLRLDDGHILFQSMAIMEYLNEAYPPPPLLPES